MDNSSLFIIAIIGMVVALVYIRKFNPRVVGGGKVSRKDSEGWIFTWNMKQNPLFEDINTHSKYKLAAYKLVTQKPLKVRCRFEENVDVGSSLIPEVLDVFLEENVNEPIPSNYISCAIFNKPGSWFFSQSGKIAVDNGLVQTIQEQHEREKEILEGEIERTRVDSIAESDRVISMVGRYLRPTVAPRDKQQQ